MYGATADGLHDVCGNVWQWVEDHMNGLPGFQTMVYYDDFTLPTLDGRHNMIMVSARVHACVHTCVCTCAGVRAPVRALQFVGVCNLPVPSPQGGSWVSVTRLSPPLRAVRGCRRETWCRALPDSPSAATSSSTSGFASFARHLVTSW